MSRILVTGSESGLGAALVEALQDDGHTVIEFDLKLRDDVMRPEATLHRGNQVDVLINCAGINGINWLKDVTRSEWEDIISTNVTGIFRMTQFLLPSLIRNKGTVLNIVSNAAHMPMRCSAAYNASKGAALMLTKQLARELADDGITVFSVSPNRMAGTEMSNMIDERCVATRGWTLEKAREYQVGSLLAKAETPPQLVAEFIAHLLQDKEHHRYLAGCDLPYGA